MWILLGVIFFYSLLSLPVTLRAEICYAGGQGGFGTAMILPGMTIGRQGIIEWNGARLRIRLRPERQKGQKQQGRKRMARMLALLRRMEPDEAWLRVMIGTGDAARTALAAGATQAALTGMLARLGLRHTILAIQPDYTRRCLVLEGRYVCFLRLGDLLMTALHRDHSRRKQKEAQNGIAARE